MPYRRISLHSKNVGTESFWVRVSDAAVAEWLPERPSLRARGYPDRPPDIDAPTLRAWLPRPGEDALSYFRERPVRLAGTGDPMVFPVFTATWHRPDGFTVKVLLTGMADGGFLSRVLIVEPSGECPVDKAHRLGPDVDPDTVWSEVETIVRAINEAPMDWGHENPMQTMYLDFLALDDEVEAAEAEARAAGLLTPEWVH